MAEFATYESAPSPRDREAFLYVVGYEGGPCKVGYSYDPKLRLQAVRRGGHVEAMPLLQVPINSRVAHRAERYAHWLLREHHLEHEWFNVTHDVAIAAIRKAVEPQALWQHEYRDPIPALIRLPASFPGGHLIQTKFPAGTRERIVSILGGATGMSDFIRDAVEAELRRHEKAKPKT